MVDMLDDDIDRNNITELRTKVVFVGDINVGKTSIINRFIENKFKESYEVINFPFILISQRSELTSAHAMSDTKARQSSFKFGIPQAKNAIRALSLAISAAPRSHSSSTMFQVTLHSD